MQQEDFAEMAKTNPSDLVSRLKNADMVCWEAFKDQILKPFLSGGTAYGMKMADKNIDIDDVYSDIFEQMVFEDALSGLRNEQALIAFMLAYVKGYINSFYGRNEKKENENDRRSRKSRKIELVFEHSLKGENALERVPAPKMEGLSDGQLLTRKKVREGFNLLWRRNPKRALALLLRYVKGLDANEVCEFLNLASRGYVDQVVSLAKGDMRTKYLPIEEVLKGDE